MEGKLALQKPKGLKGSFYLYSSMFVMGMSIEYVMCKTGFYNYMQKSEGFVQSHQLFQD